MSKQYCSVCGMGTETNLAISYGDELLQFCGAHSLTDYLEAIDQLPTPPNTTYKDSDE